MEKRWTFNTQIVKALAIFFGVSEYFVRESIKRNRSSSTADEIRKRYEEMNRETLLKIKQLQND